MITEELVRAAISKIKSPVAFDHFFDKLSSSEWIEPILKVNPKFLLNPPEPEKSENGISFPIWSASRFLARVAEQNPSQVLNVIKKVKTTNFHIHEDFVEAALKMPVPQAIEVAKLAIGWLDQDYYYFLPEKCADLAIKLARSGCAKEALQLFRAIIRPLRFEEGESKSGKARARFRDWNYEKILDSQFLTLVQVLGQPAINIAIDSLKEALQIEGRMEDEYLSHHWRSAIEDHDQNIVESVKDHLIVAVRNGYITYLKENPAKLTDVFNELIRSGLTILKRLAFYLAGDQQVGDLSLVEKVLLDRPNLEAVSTWHEVATLLRDWFSKIGLQTQSTLIDWIKEGRIESYSDEPDRDKKAWQLRMISLLGANLPADLLALHKSLNPSMGTLDHPDFHSYISSGWVGPKSPISAVEMGQMTVAQILDYLRSWEPTGDWFSPTYEGLARQLVEVVKARPSEFLAEPSELFSLNPTYCRAVVEALGGTEHAFDWGKALDFFEWIIRQGIHEETGRIEDEDPGFNWARVSIVRLFQKAFDSSERSLPVSTRKRVWAIIEPVTKDPHPTAESEARYLGDRTDYYQHCINTSRGTALETVVLYALWIRRNAGLKGEEPSIDLVPEVKEILESHLDISIDPQLSIRSVYGRWFAWLTLLSSDWAKSLMPKIFPEDPNLKRYRESAWFTYLVYGGFFNSVFDLLNAYYDDGIQQLSLLDEDCKVSSMYDPELRLSEHLMLACARGLADEKMIDQFFSAAPKSIRSHAINYIGRALGPDVPAPMLERTRALWERRVKEDTKVIQEELREFGWWTISHAFDPSWALEHLALATERAGAIEPDSLLLQDLLRYTESEPEKVLRFIEVFIAGPIKNSAGWFSKDDLYKLLRELKGNLAGEHLERFRNAINRLGAAGYLDFRDLLITSGVD